MSSLTTLGYICEEIHPDDVSDQVKNALVVSLVNNISASQNEDALILSRIACKALSFSIPFASQNFRVKHERDFIMERIFMAMESNDEES